MKTKTFLLLCLFLGIGLTQLSAQLVFHLNEKGTGTIINRAVFDFGDPVFCTNEQGDFVQVDYLVGTVTYQGVYVFKNGVYQRGNEYYLGGDFQSTYNPNSTEVFKLIEKDHAPDISFVEGDPIPYGTDTFHVNFIGNEGSHYVATCIWDIHSQTFAGVIRAVCPGNE